MLKKLKKRVNLALLRRRFDSAWYLARYQDVAQAHVDAWYHYITYGRKEGRYLSEQDEAEHEMDYRAYLRENPDVKKSNFSPVEHYLKYGKKEGRNFPRKFRSEVSNCFDEDFYLRVYPDVHKLKMTPWEHYNKYGRKEGRLPKGNKRAIEIIRSSKLFNFEWYTRTYPDVKDRGVDPAEDFYVYGLKGKRNPGPGFSAQEYLLLNPDIALAGVNPLVHYESHGRNEKRLTSLTQIKPYVFPQGAIETTQILNSDRRIDHRRVCIFASFSGNGKIEEYVLHLLNGIKRVCDVIIFVADNPILQDEISRLEGICDVCIFRRHNEYDFGSYKMGYKYVMEHDIVKNDDELIFMNDSCYGPAHPFTNVIEDYKNKSCDFYGLSISTTPQDHIQSFFYIFKPNVYRSEAFSKFLYSVKKELSTSHVIYKYEVPFTKVLEDAGFSYASFVPRDWFKQHSLGSRIIPTQYTNILIKHYGYPLVKIKALVKERSQSHTLNENGLLQTLQNKFPELNALINRHLSMRVESVRKVAVYKPTIVERLLYSKYAEEVSIMQNKLKSGDKIHIEFLVSSEYDTFLAMLALEFQKQNCYEVDLYVIPDASLPSAQAVAQLKSTLEKLKIINPRIKSAVTFDDQEIIEYIDVVSSADIVCFPSMYDISFSLYNPGYAASMNKLAFYVYEDNKDEGGCFSLDNLNNFWRVYFSSKENMENYKNQGLCNGYNACLMVDCNNVPNKVDIGNRMINYIKENFAETFKCQDNNQK